jgi:hypothetical protein
MPGARTQLAFYSVHATKRKKTTVWGWGPSKPIDLPILLQLQVLQFFPAPGQTMTENAKPLSKSNLKIIPAN